MSTKQTVWTRTLKFGKMGALIITLYASQAQCAPVPAIGSQSGVEQEWFDKSVRPQDDLYRATNGRWLDTTPISSDSDSTSYIGEAKGKVTHLMQELLESAAASHASVGTPMQRMGDFYASYLDEASIQARGTSPLKPTFERIDAIRGPDDLAATFGYLESIGVHTMFGFWISTDSRDASHHLTNFLEFGTTINDHLYLDEDATSIQARTALAIYVGRILKLSGDPDALANANRVVEFERAIAKIASGREPDSSAVPIPVRTDATYSLADVQAWAPHFGWAAYWTATGLAGRINAMLISQPQTLAALDRLLTRTSIDTIKVYLKYQYAHHRVRYLPKSFTDVQRIFYDKGVTEETDPEERAWDGVEVVTDNLRDEPDIEYAKRHFTRAQKAYMQSMFINLKKAYAGRIAEARWMAPKTREHALLKLGKMTAQFGAPDDTSGIVDYSTVVIARDDLFGNVERTQRVNYNHRIAQLDRPVNKHQWQVDTCEVGAHYELGTNRVVVGCGVLQPPFYYADADDAINYGTLGFLISHEMAHAFDTGGAEFDADGNVRDWWTEADREHFKMRTQMLADQFNRYFPVPGYHIDGARTLIENIAESAGLDAAFRAYRISLGKRTAAVIDGLTGEQRFYHGFAQLHREKTADLAMIETIKTDTHSPSEFRVNGTVRNQQGFYDTFGVKPTDKLYLPPGQRFTLW